VVLNFIKIVKEKFKRISKKDSDNRTVKEKTDKLPLTTGYKSKRSFSSKRKVISEQNNRKFKSENEISINHRTKTGNNNFSIDNKKEKENLHPSEQIKGHQSNHIKKEKKGKINLLIEKKKHEEDKWDISEYKVPAVEGKTRFHDFNLQKELMHAIYNMGFLYCTPIQKAILKSTLQKKDATGKAQTGTGKTAAFLITIINNFLTNPSKAVRRPGAPRALIIAPTRELVMQIAEDARALVKYTDIAVAEVYGGMEFNKQLNRMKRGLVDILVATPGRLLDFQKRHVIFLGNIEIIVIDEADRMLDMGFIPDVKKIINSTPPKSKRQTLFFSATLNDDVRRLANQWTKDAVNVEIEPAKITVESIKQIVYIVTNDQKFALLYNIIKKENLDKVLVFANRKDEAHPLYEMLLKFGLSSEVLSGDVDQRKRIKTLNDFKEGKIKILVATDVASRGIHVDDISHVINFTLPQDPEDYIHRIGRTGRAGASGTSISFASEDDSFYIPAIEKFIGKKFDCIYPDEDLLKEPVINH